jgi:hypothetical protein
MAGATQIPLFSAAKVAQEAAVRQSDNGLFWTTFGEVHNSSEELEKIVLAVPGGDCGGAAAAGVVLRTAGNWRE